MFEGLGLGSRLSVLPLPSRFKWGELGAEASRLCPATNSSSLSHKIFALRPFSCTPSSVPYAAGCLYAVITPLGLAIGLGVRETYNPDSANAVIVAGTLDAFSAGILLYTGLVELLAHDFIFSRESESSSFLVP